MRSSLENFFLREWQRASAWQLVLRPISWLFGILTALRRGLFRMGLLRAHSVAAPVIVIGNITVGGTGKTPLVIALAERLTHSGKHVGVITRGYVRKGGAVVNKPFGTIAPVADHRPTIEASDEATLMSQRLAAPVFANPSRVDAAEWLLKRYPQTNAILSDDGLQHYKLKRDIEIAVMDGVRGFGNGALLPAGPLREPIHRLSSVDCIVLNETGLMSTEALANSPNGAEFEHKMAQSSHQWGSLKAQLEQFEAPLFSMRFGNEHFRRVGKRAIPKELAESASIFVAMLQGKKVAATAGIGNPERFFSHLQLLGIALHSRHPFADHHAFTALDFTAIEADVILMTEKDAVKCSQFADERLWCMRVDALLPDAFYEFIESRLNNVARPQAA
jgi:tetraacyldisaccharide 4'-kinase